MTRTGDRLLDDRGLLDRAADPRLRARIGEGIRRARRTGVPTLVSASSELHADADPAAIVYASRVGDEPWFCFEQPDRERISLATLGAVRTLEAAGPTRFDELAQRWRALADVAIADTPAADEAPGAGLTAVGGFAFASDGAADPAWRGFATSSLVVPELSLARRGRRTWLTVNVEVAPDDDPARLIAHVERRLAALRDNAAAVARPGTDRSLRGRLGNAPGPLRTGRAAGGATDPRRASSRRSCWPARSTSTHRRRMTRARCSELLREAFGSSFVYAVGRGDATFIGATPGAVAASSRASGRRTVALAGSTRRSADPAVDDHLGEQLLHSDKDRPREF